jgi:hypothetical protein
MTNLERRRGERLPAARPTPQLPSAYLRADDLERVPVLTWRDIRIDRRNESRHILELRELQREAIEGAAAIARDAYIDIAAIDARRRINSEAKYELHLAKKESQILADEDLELAAKYARLDDDLYADVRWIGLQK